MSSVEAEYQALRDKLNEQDGTFKNELLSILEEAAREREPLTEEEEAESKEFAKDFFGGENLRFMNECMTDLNKITRSKELEKARAILNGVPLPNLQENEIETREHYFTVTELKQMRPEVLAHHIKVLEKEMTEEPLKLTSEMFGV